MNVKALASAEPETALNVPQAVGVMVTIAESEEVAGILNLQFVSPPEPIIWGVEPESTLTLKNLS